MKLHRFPVYCLTAALGLATVLFLLSCGGGATNADDPLRIVAGSESKEIEHIIMAWADDNNLAVEMHYKGSVDMMLDMQQESFAFDAVLPANSMWIRLGDAELHRVKDEASIMRSPVVLGVKKSIAEQLGWVGTEVSVNDLLEAVRSGQLSFAMTSSTQSNSGASAYMGLLYALAGRPEALTSEHLADPELGQNIRDLLGGIDRSSGSSGWLKEMFLEKYDSLDAMFNYESMIISANQELVRQGREPLYAIYLTDGQAIADSTLGFVSKPDNAHKREMFVQLRDYLLTPEAQEQIFQTGFRTALIGMNPENPDTSVYNPAWGIDLDRTITPITWPRPEVTMEALQLYQTSFRKPSQTVYLLDVSGSMEGQGLNQLKQAMLGLLNQENAGRYLLQASADDVIVVIPFNDRVVDVWMVQGNDSKDITDLMNRIASLQAGGGTDIYQPIIAGLQLFSQVGRDLNDYLPAIVLLTDGRSQSGSLYDVQNAWSSLRAPFELPPVFCVTFGDADDSQLKEIAEYTVARVFDGRHGLEAAFRKAKGYN
ncbi:MAG: VWA domain-containing protein [Desulfovibrio sp.]|nr:MAG: VWA domain-containing protein [Desulfovibrio sp.]